MTNEQQQQLIEGAQQGVKNGLSKNGKADDFRIGAAVLTDTGNIYSSGFYYSNTGSLTLHAEQCALVVAAAHGEYSIEAIAIAWNEAADAEGEDSSVYPCHMCKQLLWENYLRSGINMEILIIENGAIAERFFLKDIMTHTWPR